MAKQEQNEQGRNFIVIAGILLLLIAFVGAIVFVEWSERRKEQEVIALEESRQAELDALKAEMMMTILTGEADPEEESDGISARNVLDGQAEGTVLVTPDYFKQNARLGSAYMHGDTAFAALQVSAKRLEPEDLLVCQFEAYTEEGSAELLVQCDDMQIKLYLTEKPTTFYIPISEVEQLDKITFTLQSDFTKTTLDKMYVVNYGQNYTIEQLKAGAYGHDAVELRQIPDQSLTGEYSSQCLVKGPYLFNVFGGNILSYAMDEAGNSTLLSAVKWIGPTQDMAFNADQTALLVTTRQNGLYVIDITDPANLQILSHYDTLEAAIGLDVCGQYAFVCSRFFGVEIVDISDLTHPRFVSKVSGNAEYRDCFVDQGYLYVSGYSSERMDVYDLADLSAPELVSQITLDGFAQGCFVKDGVLYVATGMNSNNPRKALWNYGTGTGNGMEVYDVSNPAEPVRLSIVKLDGRFNYSANNTWDVQVSGQYAYLASAHNGVYVYDVADPSRPVCIRQYRLSISPEDSRYETFAEGIVFPWDIAKEDRGCACHVAVEAGRLYVAMSNAGVYAVPEETAAAVTREPAALTASGTQPELPETEGVSLDVWHTEDCVWAVAVKDPYIYVAAGEGGIKILDQDLQQVGSVSTAHSVRDVKIFGSYLFTAESEGGIVSYEIHGLGLTKLSEISMEGRNLFASQLALTHDGKFILAQVSASKHISVDARDPYHLAHGDIESTATGSMYYRNICTGLVDGKYVGVYGRNQICWYYSDGSRLVALDPMENTYYKEENGMAAAGDQCLFITQGGYACMDVSENGMSEPGEVQKIKTALLYGKVSISEDLLVVTNGATGEVTLFDISDLEKPALISKMTLPGTPDIGCSMGDDFLIPCRYDGLYRVTVEDSKA